MKEKKLRQIPVEDVKPNPDNPRIIFRQEELDGLLVSIGNMGVQVPISVYEEGDKFILIDGERRWRTCKKLNHKTIPAIIQDRPTALENLLLMFNIHSLREQWDLFTIANKLTRILELLKKQLKRDPNEIEISAHTGLNRGTIRRSKLLIELPQKYKDIILEELHKPKSKQKFTEDFFIEMENSLKTVRNNFPNLLPDMNSVRDVLIDKYKREVIGNITDFRKLGKLATSPKNVNFGTDEAASAITQVLSLNQKGISEVFDRTVGSLYDEKKVISNVESLIFFLENLRQEEKEDEDLRNALLKIRNVVDRILGEEV
jgi:ParB/RepB/Spo0J family partition protein